VHERYRRRSPLCSSSTLYSKDEIFKTDVDGTNNLLEAANKHKDTRFIHISSTAVYGIPDHHPVYENDKLEGVGPYGEAKILAEKACEEYREKGMCMTILRPKTFIGPERLGVFAMLYDWALSGANFPMIGNGKNQYQLLDVEDLCEAIYLSANKENPIVNDTFNVAAKEFQTMKQDYQAILDKAGKGKRIVCLPEKPTIWTLKLLEKLRLSPLYKWVYETASKDSYISIEKAEKKLGYHPKFSNQDALLRNFDWYINNQSNFREHSGISHRVPWKQGALRIAKRAFKLF